jgi:hypothetical protein
MLLLAMPLPSTPRCPYCAGTLLRHIKGASLHWFCRHCWQIVPDLEAITRQPLGLPRLLAPDRISQPGLIPLHPLK